MKILCNSRKLDIFNLKDTEMPYYNQFLRPNSLSYMQEDKNITGEIKYMTCDEYMQECVNFGRWSSIQSIEDYIERNRAKVDTYIDLMQDGVIFPLPMLDYIKRSQEGFRRMYCAREIYGSNAKFPVLVVRKYDPDREIRR